MIQVLTFVKTDILKEFRKMKSSRGQSTLHTLHSILKRTYSIQRYRLSTNGKTYYRYVALIEDDIERGRES